jgi:hypothetical protein
MSLTWRSDCPVLVTDAHAMGSIAVIRSLGRAGYPVHSCSQHADALGFFSAFNKTRAICPPYSDPAFLDWLRCYIQRHKIRAIVPSEGFFLSVRPFFKEFSPLIPFSSSESVVYAAMSKYDQFATLANDQRSKASKEHLPPLVFVESKEEVPTTEALDALGAPLYVKVDGCYSRGGEGGTVHKASSGAEAQQLTRKLITRYSRVLIQGHVQGQGTGAFFLVWDGKLLAEFMHLRLHEVPHTGGVSSYRKSWWHQKMRDDALAKMKAMSWQGVGMMEYRWDPATDQFHLVEMNGRFWGSLHLPIFSGVDFPALLVDAFHGRPPLEVVKAREEAACRYTFPRELMYVWSRWKDAQVSWPSKFSSILEFFLLGLDPRIYSDLWFAGDRMLYWRQLLRSFRELAQ